MKKLCFLFVGLAFLASCDEDDDKNSGPYTTDSLVLKAEKNALLMQGYNFNLNVSVGFDIARHVMEDVYGRNLNHVSFLDQGAGNFYYDKVDTILNNFQTPTFPYFYLNGLSSNIGTLQLEIEDAITGRPLASVANVVSSNDTAWVVDCKVKFFMDTLSSGIFIETYMLADIQAANYDPLEDLRFTELPGFVANDDFSSKWAASIPNIDTTKSIFNQGETVVHRYIAQANFNTSSAWGTSMGEYSPFGGEFANGDVYGTRHTPIRHHFLKPKAGEFDYNRKVRFLTVVWILNPFSNSMEYVNSYMNNSTY